MLELRSLQISSLSISHSHSCHGDDCYTSMIEQSAQRGVHAAHGLELPSSSIVHDTCPPQSLVSHVPDYLLYHPAYNVFILIKDG